MVQWYIEVIPEQERAFLGEHVICFLRKVGEWPKDCSLARVEFDPQNSRICVYYCYGINQLDFHPTRIANLVKLQQLIPATPEKLEFFAHYYGFDPK